MQSALTLMGERTYQQQVHVDLYGNQGPSKRKPMRGKAAESNDIPELREATQEAIRRHGVRVVILDEAHHMMYAGTGMQGSTLQEQLEWLKSLSSKTHVLHILVGTYDLLNFGQLNGQISRRCLPVHFPRYQLQREVDCLEFQAALLALLKKVPLICDAETLVGSYWVYFYEGCIGCIGVLKDWLLRAVSTALDEGQDMLSLDWIADHAPPTDICRQMALDATEGEQKLNHTESNREHLWRLLQGGELIAPLPPLPSRETSSRPLFESIPQTPQPSEGSGLVDVGTQESGLDVPKPSVKKTRSRKKVEVQSTDSQGQGSLTQIEPKMDPDPVPTPPKRGRRKKTETPVGEDPEPRVNMPQETRGEMSSGSTDAGSIILSPKPKRTKRVGEPAAKRYVVGEPETSQSI